MLRKKINKKKHEKKKKKQPGDFEDSWGFLSNTAPSLGKYIKIIPGDRPFPRSQGRKSESPGRMVLMVTTSGKTEFICQVNGAADVGHVFAARCSEKTRGWGRFFLFNQEP